MRNQTFYDWLTREVATSRMALIGLYENRDRILYMEAPPLRKKYMDLIGNFEETVLQAELEVSLLHRKVEMIQIAINRRELVDLAAIDAQLEAEKEQQVSALENADLTLNELPQLTEQEERTIQRQYREITSAFHPAMNPNLTDTQKELYKKALDAYKLQDVEVMKIIYNMLFSPTDMGEFQISISHSPLEYTPEEQRADYRAIATEFSTDYLLAKKLYACFVPLEEDSIVLDTLHGYDAQRKEIEEEIARIRAGFPFNAVATMNDPTKTQEYLAELRIRARNCETEKAALEKQIATMTGGRADGG